MGYYLNRLNDYPAVLLQLDADIEAADVGKMLIESADLFEDIKGLACLMVDISALTHIDMEQLARSLQVFQRTSPTFKADAPILITMVGNNPLRPHLVAAFEAARFLVPTFTSDEEALSYLNLKIESEYIKQTLAHIETDELATMHTAGINPAEVEQQYTAADESARFPTSGVLRLTHRESGKSFLVIPKQEIYIGRRSEDQSKPTIDLSMWGAYQYGISRRHAKLIREDGFIKLIDLGSSNGTYLNDVRVRPHIAVILRDSDELCFGELAVRVNFEDTLK